MYVYFSLFLISQINVPSRPLPNLPAHPAPGRCFRCGVVPVLCSFFLIFFFKRTPCSCMRGSFELSALPTRKCENRPPSEKSAWVHSSALPLIPCPVPPSHPQLLLIGLPQFLGDCIYQRPKPRVPPKWNTCRGTVSVQRTPSEWNQWVVQVTRLSLQTISPSLHEG